MNRKAKVTMRIGAVLGAALLWGCTFNDSTPPVGPSDQDAHEAAKPVLTGAAGMRVPQALMRVLLSRITREVAVALADAELRTFVYSRLHASPFADLKVHFRTFLTGTGQPLLGAMASARGTTARDVLSTLDSVVDLEFHMPMPEHIAAWGGGPDLLVASALKDDGGVPVGFDLAGEEVTLSASEPPRTPTLTLVPVETDFSRPPGRSTIMARVSGAASSLPGVYMTSQTIFDDHEGWAEFPPEFEVHVFRQNDAGQYVDVICAGEFQDAPYYYDAAEGTWSGPEVLLVTQATIGEGTVQLQVWEDDTGACTATGGRPPKTTEATIADWSRWAASIAALAAAIKGGNPYVIVTAGLNAIPAAFNFANEVNPDDPVGALILPNECWPEPTGPVYYEIREEKSGHALAGYASLDWRIDSQERTPLCPLGVTINGPAYVEVRSGVPSPAPHWTASVTYGTGTINYAWYDNDAFVSSSSDYTMEPIVFGSHVIRADVTREDRSGSGALDVLVEDVCPGCPEGPTPTSMRVRARVTQPRPPR